MGVFVSEEKIGLANLADASGLPLDSLESQVGAKKLDWAHLSSTSWQTSSAWARSRIWRCGVAWLPSSSVRCTVKARRCLAAQRGGHRR